jgi:transcriptional regulator with XRE-family HTH domain
MSMPSPVSDGPSPEFHLDEMGKRLRKLRKEHGLKQAQAAAIAGVSAGQMSGIERGVVRSPGLAGLLALQREYGLKSIEELFGDMPSFTLVNQPGLDAAAGKVEPS